MPALFLLLTLLATCTQWVLNEKSLWVTNKGKFFVRDRYLWVGNVLHWFWMNRATVDFGADINNELSCKKRDAVR